MVTETLECECGIFICGKSIEVAASNLEQHRKTQKHRNQLAEKNIRKMSFKCPFNSRIIKNEDGDYELIAEGYDWEEKKQLQIEIAVINYEKNTEK